MYCNNQSRELDHEITVSLARSAPLSGHPPPSLEATDLPSLISAYSGFASNCSCTQGLKQLAFRPACASWMPINVPWEWTKSTIRLSGAICESCQMPASSGEICRRRSQDGKQWEEEGRTYSSFGDYGGGFHYDCTDTSRSHGSIVHEMPVSCVPVVGRVCPAKVSVLKC